MQSILTAADWRGNALADAAAKLAANSNRAPKHVRDRYAQLVAAHRYGAAIAGMACLAANNHMAYATCTDGSLEVIKLRDSTGRPSRLPPRAANKTSVAKPATASGSPTADESCHLDDALPKDFPRTSGGLPLCAAAELLNERPSSCPSRRKTTPASSRPAAKSRRRTASCSRAAKVFGLTGQEAVQAAALANRLQNASTTATPLSPRELRNRVERLVLAASEPPPAELARCIPAETINRPCQPSVQDVQPACPGVTVTPAAPPNLPSVPARLHGSTRAAPQQSAQYITGAMSRLMYGSGCP